jgi:hypothetical protein
MISCHAFACRHAIFFVLRHAFIRHFMPPPCRRRFADTPPCRHSRHYFADVCARARADVAACRLRLPPILIRHATLAPADVTRDAIIFWLTPCR